MEDESLDLDMYRQELTEQPQYTTIVDSAFEVIKRLKIPIDGYAGEAPDMPVDITNIPDSELGEYLNKQTQWAGYLSQKLAEYESYLTVLMNELEFTQASIHTDYIKDPEIKATKITERKELMKTDKRYVTLNREKLRYEIICNIIKANVNATNNNWVNLSRQITLKGQDQYREHRAFNANGINNTPKEASPQGPRVKAFTNSPIGIPNNANIARRSKR